MKLLIAIPALNEEQSISSIIERSLAAVPGIIREGPVTSVAITVVSDGSTDRTVELARAYEGKVSVIVFPENRGYGAAIMAAWESSNAELLAFLDADGTCDPNFFASLCRALESQNADIVLGSRMYPESQMPALRRLGNRIFSLLLASLSNKRVKDTASGMRVVRRSALRYLYPLPSRLHFTPAMSARAMLSDSVRLAEIDMPYAEREGKSKLRVLRDGLRFLGTILGTALLYRPGRLLNISAIFAMGAAAILLLGPSFQYLQKQALEEWMIYRFLVSSFLAQVAVLAWGAGAISSRIVGVAIQEEIRYNSRGLMALLRRRSAWAILALLCGVGGFLIFPSAVQLLQTGHTDVHWSRFVVALTSFNLAVALALFKVQDRLLDLVNKRVRYLASNLERP